MKLVEVAELCYEAGRIYSRHLGANERPSWDTLHLGPRQVVISGLEFVLAGLKRGVHIAAWDIHAAWLQRKLDGGWLHGEELDEEKKTDPTIKPFHELPKDTQRQYYLFVGIIEACYRCGIEG